MEKHPSPSTKPVTQPSWIRLSCWLSAPMALSRYCRTATVLVAWDTQVFQHIARCAPRSYLRGGQRFTLGPFLLLRPAPSCGAGGPDISADLSWSPMRADYLISTPVWET